MVFHRLANRTDFCRLLAGGIAIGADYGALRSGRITVVDRVI
jgi:hypothetical protein